MVYEKNSRTPQRVQAHLPKSNSRTEKRTCGCGKEYETKIYIFGKKETDGSPFCDECLKKQNDIRLKEEEKQNNERIQKRVTFVKDKMRESIPPKYRGSTFVNFKKELQPKAFKTLSSFKGKSVILCSPNVWGVGKTHLVYALVNKIIDDLQPNEYGTLVKPFYIATENELLLRVRTTYQNKFTDSETEDDVYKDIKKYPLVIIDDVGKVIPSDLSFLQRVYFQIINDRYDDNMPIIITTNLDRDQLSKYIGIACADRLAEMCGSENIVIMAGKSYRVYPQ